MRTTILSLVVVGLVGFVSQANAECRPDDKKQIAFHTEVIDGKATLVIETEVIVCGKPARPAVAYVTGPKDVDYSWTLERMESMLPKIFASLAEMPLSGGSR